MHELYRTSDPVRLSFIEAMLAGAGIGYLVLDRNIGAIYGGALPARIMVDEADASEAAQILVEMNASE